MIKPISPTLESLRSLQDSSMFNEEKRKNAEQKVLDSMNNQKRTISEKAPWLLKNPEKPELDEERMNDYKTLTKVGAAGQLVDSLAGLVMSGAKKDYQHVNSGIGQIANIGVNEIRAMDEEHRKRLEQYGERVFNIEQANRQALAQAEQQNKVIDTEVAKTELGFANNRQLQALENEVYNLQNSNPQAKPYTDAALRLISQGEEEAGLALLEKAGMDVEVARSFLGQGAEETGAGKFDAINALLGYNGEDQGVTQLQVNMMRDYHALMKDIEENPASEDYNSLDGSPKSARAKRLEALGKELGQLRYVPAELLNEQPAPNAAATGSAETPQPQAPPAVSQAQGNEWLKKLQSSKTPEEYGENLLTIAQKADSAGVPQEKILEELARFTNPEDPMYTFNEGERTEAYVKSAELSAAFDKDIGAIPEGGVEQMTNNQLSRIQNTLKGYARVFANPSADHEKQDQAIEQFTYTLIRLGYSEVEIEQEIQQHMESAQKKVTPATSYGGVFINDSESK